MSTSRQSHQMAVLSLCSALVLIGTSSHAAAHESLGKLLLSQAALDNAMERGELEEWREVPLQRLPDEPGVARSGGKNYLLPGLEIVGFQFLLNRFDNAFVGNDYNVSWSSIRRNLRSSWVQDRDPFLINQFGHPYQGTVYYGLARSTGMNFWESMGYAFGGSAVWEIAGETTLPSRNDQITTSFAGTFLGESLYRMANYMLERGPGSRAFREWSAAAISPPTAFNRLAFPDRFGKLFQSGNPATFSRLQFGASNARKTDTLKPLRRNEAIVDFTFDYGLPGKSGYHYTRPFDYFNFQVRGSSVRGLESVHNRGLLIGTDYEAGPSYRGIWGLYGSFDYLAPQLFRLSSTALSLGTTAQWQPLTGVTLQGTATAGMGYTSTGTIRPTPSREYNYGFAPQALLALKCIFGDRISLDVTARKYFAGRLRDSDTGGRDEVLRADASLTYRIDRRHAVALKYLSSRRNASFAGGGATAQRRDTIGIYYTWLGTSGLGKVLW